MLSKSTPPHSLASNFRLMSVHFPMPRNRPTLKIRIYQYELQYGICCMESGKRYEKCLQSSR